VRGNNISVVKPPLARLECLPNGVPVSMHTNGVHDYAFASDLHALVEIPTLLCPDSGASMRSSEKKSKEFMAGCNHAAYHRPKALPTFFLRMTSRRVAGFCGSLALSLLSQPVFAQQDGPSITLDFYRPQTLIAPNVPSGFDRGGNISIEQIGHPGYDQLAIQLGSFDLYPSLDTFVGASSNVLLSKANPKSDMLVGSALSIYAKADWGSSSFVLIGKDWENVWLHNAVRSQDQGNIDGSYQFDISDELTGAVEGAFNRYGDNNSIGTVNNLSAILEMTQRTFIAGRVQYQAGQFSEIISSDRTHFNLDPVYSEETGLEQSYFDDHTVYRVTSQTEFAFTPSVAAFAQFGGYKTIYNTILPSGLPNYNSFSLRGVIGLSLDIPGLLRGQVSAGFGHRSYDSPLYTTPTELVIATKLEFFLDNFNNITLTLLKDFDDGTLYSSTPIKYTTVSILYERQAKTNLLLGFQANEFKQTVINLGSNPSETNSTGSYNPPANFSNYGASVYATFLVNRHFSIRTEFGGERFINNNAFANVPDGQSNTEFRGVLTFTFKP